MKPPCILIVEGENNIALDLHTHLTRLDFRVAGTAVNGADAIDKSLSLKPDLILIDIPLKGEMDGIKTAQQIQSRQNIPVLFLTADADNPALQQAVDTRPFGYILKPFEERTLGLAMQGALYCHQMEQKLQKTSRQEQTQRLLAEALRDISIALNSSLNQREIITCILESISQVVPSDRVSILLREQDLLFVVGAMDQTNDSFYPVNELEGRYPIDDFPVLKKIAAQKTPIIISDTRTDPLSSAFSEAAPVLAFMGTAIQYEDRLLGFITVSNLTPDAFTEQQASHLEIVANQAAIALENARLHEQIHTYANQLEQRVAQRTEELEQERSRLQLILDTAAEGIYFTNINHQILYVNPAIELICGQPAADLLGNKVQVLGNATNPAVFAAMNDKLATGQNWRGHISGQQKNGAYFEATIHVTPLRNTSDKLVGFVGLLRDTTQIKELDRLKDQFVSRIGHELRTPLSNFKLYMDLLERGSELKRPHYLNILRHETNRMNKLVEGFLEISHLTAHIKPLHLEPVHINELINNILENHESAATKRQLILDINLTRGLLPARADITLLARALNHLVENAINFTPQNGRVTLSSRQQTISNQQWIIIEVTDTGPGISEEEQKHIYERFFRGELARDFKTPGAGLGLAICQEIMNQLDGQIAVTSQPDVGTTFTLSLKAISLS